MLEGCEKKVLFKHLVFLRKSLVSPKHSQSPMWIEGKRRDRQQGFLKHLLSKTYLFLFSPFPSHKKTNGDENGERKTL